jgi:hypothetical protein
MRSVFWAPVILALVALGVGLGLSGVAQADPQNLAGGVMIAHYPAGLAYSSDPPQEGWCAKYQNEFGITSAEQQVNRTDVLGAPVFWFVLSAWYEPKEFCGAEFGLGDYDDEAFAIVEYDACGDGFDPLEIPTGAWPSPNTGVSIAVSGDYAWTGNYVPIYYFVGYIYAPGTMIEIVPDYRGPDLEPFAGWANCEQLPVLASAACLGAFGILRDGAYCEPLPPGETPGACCFDGGTCLILLPDECAAAGGSWDGSSWCSDPNPCPITWACCTHDEQTGDETCQMLTVFECGVAGGIWHEGRFCQSFTCPAIRACCIDQYYVLTTLSECVTIYEGNWMPDAFSCTTPSNPCRWIRACCLGETCQLLSEDECASLEGVWHEEWSSCGPPNPCQGIPATPETWGGIKNLYR